MVKNSCQILHSEYTIGHDFLDMQYVICAGYALSVSYTMKIGQAFLDIQYVIYADYELAVNCPFVN